MWITVPAWALVGTIAIYIVSTRYSVTRPLELTFESADISDNIMRQNVYTYIIGSKADSYSVDVNSEYDNVQVMDEYYGDTTYSQSMNIERCASDDGITMKFDTHIPFGGISLQASSVTYRYWFLCRWPGRWLPLRNRSLRSKRRKSIAGRCFGRERAIAVPRREACRRLPVQGPYRRRSSG